MLNHKDEFLEFLRTNNILCQVDNRHICKGDCAQILDRLSQSLSEHHFKITIIKNFITIRNITSDYYCEFTIKKLKKLAANKSYFDETLNRLRILLL